MKKKEKET